MSTVTEYALLCAVAAVAGAVNAMAGGGTLLTFPALLAALTPSHGAAAGVIANATSTVALVPGALAALWGYRRELVDVRPWIVRLAPPSLVGGVIGSLLLTLLPAETFEFLVPWLILTAAALLALQPTIARLTGVGQPHHAPGPGAVAGVIAFQLLVAIYGGYFGAGIGILMLSSLALMGLSDIHRMNALKTLLNLLINGVSVAVFIGTGKVHWPYAGAMLLAAIVGGYGGARLARSLDKNLVRRGVVAIGFVLAAYYWFQH